MRRVGRGGRGPGRGCAGLHWARSGRGCAAPVALLPVRRGGHQVVEVCTGRLALDQLDAGVLAVVADLRAFGHETVDGTCGFGCESDLLAQWHDVPVTVAGLADYLAELERWGVYELGEADLIVHAASVEFLFCHEG